MSQASQVTVPTRRSAPRPRWPRTLRSPQGKVGLLLLVLVVGVALIGPLVAPHAIDEPIGAPGNPPGSGAALGTDYLGRDVLSRALHGGTSVLWVAFVTTALVYLVGVTVGMIAGLSRSLVDPILMRIVDVFLVFPPLVLLLVLFAGAGTGVGVLIVGIVLVLGRGWLVSFGPPRWRCRPTPTSRRPWRAASAPQRSCAGRSCPTSRPRSSPTWGCASRA